MSTPASAVSSLQLHANFTFETFNSTLNWSRWVKRLESAFNIFKVTNENLKLHYLLHYMGHESYDILCDKITPKDPETMSYEEVVSTLKDYFSPEPLEMMENYKFHQRCQQDGESIHDFLKALQRLSTTCKFGSYLDTALRNQFVFGLQNQNIQARLLEVADLTLQSALNKAYSMDIATKNAAQIQKTNFDNQKNFYTADVDLLLKRKMTKPRTKKNAPQVKCFRCGQAGHVSRTCEQQNLVCKFCKKKGHLESVCFKKGKLNLVHNETLFSSSEGSDSEALQLNSASDVHTQTSVQGNRDKICVIMIVNNKEIQFELDTGASVTVMGIHQFRENFGQATLSNTSLRLQSYCNKDIQVLGVYKVNVTYGTVKKQLNLYVVNSHKQALLGREWLYEIPLDWSKIWCQNDVSHVENKTIPKAVQALFLKYSNVTEPGIGKTEYLEAKISIKPDSNPIFCKARRVPFSLLSKIEAELDNLVEQGVLKKVESSEWATPIVPVLKPNGNVRICGDYKVTINKCIQVDDHPLPTVDELFLGIAGGEKFTKLDLSQAYLHLPVREKDRSYLTLNTHRGLYEPTRLFFGLASAPAVWQREMKTMLSHIEGVEVLLDDIRITAENDEEHLKRLEQVLKCLSHHNLKVNMDKCSFMQPQIEYCGYVINKFGIKKAPNKVQAVLDMKRPTDKTEIRAMLGLVNYYGRFFKNLSDILLPFNKLLQKNVPFLWSKQCEKSFQTIKTQIASDNVLCHFDPRLPLVVASDASSHAVGAVLSHIFPDGVERPIQFASQTLNKTQQKYSQIDKEAYAIIFAIKKFHQFLFGRRFTLFCDHKPLVQIFSPTKGIPLFSALRMQHYAIFLQGFTYDIKYKNTKLHGNADAMSRLPLNSEDTYMFEESDIVEIQNIETLPLSVEQVAQHTQKDSTLLPLFKALQTGKVLAPELRFNINQEEFSLQSNCLMRGLRVVIPTSLRRQVLDELHSVHFGINKMKSLARSFCWWHQIDKDIENIARNCPSCLEIANNPSKISTHVWETPTEVFDRVHVDFAGPFNGHYFFILVDALSRWPEVFLLKDITTQKTITSLREIFSRFGIPKCLVSDNGAQFTSHEFQQFLQSNGIIHKRTAPYHPATNGLAERFVQTLKQSLKAMKLSKVPLELQLYSLLMTYRKTPHCTTGKSPSAIMFQREIRTRLDLIRPEKKKVDKKPNSCNTSKLKIRNLPLNTRVSARNYNNRLKWVFGHIVKKLGNLHYLIRLDDGRVWKRHINQLRKIGNDAFNETLDGYNNVEIPESAPTISTEPQENDNFYRNAEGLRRSVRERRPPNRLNL